MRTLIVVDSQFGNTHRIAEAIARGVRAAGLDSGSGLGSGSGSGSGLGSGSGSGLDGDIRVVIASDVTVDTAATWRPDLLLVGGPTVNRGMRTELRAAMDQLGRSVSGIPASAFDTRYRGSELFMGSAAKRAMDALRRSGCPVAAQKESFYVAATPPPPGERRRNEDVRLEPGEEDRAEAWGRAVASAGGGAPGAAAGRAGAAVS